MKPCNSKGLMLSPIYSAACFYTRTKRTGCKVEVANKAVMVEKNLCIARILGSINKCNLCLCWCRCRMELRSAGRLIIFGLMLQLCSSLGKFCQKQHRLFLLPTSSVAENTFLIWSEKSMCQIMMMKPWATRPSSVQCYFISTCLHMISLNSLRETWRAENMCRPTQWE